VGLPIIFALISPLLAISTVAELVIICFCIHIARSRITVNFLDYFHNGKSGYMEKLIFSAVVFEIEDMYNW